MSDFDSLTAALTFSLVHVLTVIYLNSKNARRSKPVCLKLFAISFLIILSSGILIQDSCLYYPVVLFLLPLCTFYVYRLSIAEAFALSVVSDFIILFGELAVRTVMNKYHTGDFASFGGFMQTVLRILFFLFIVAVLIAFTSFTRKRATGRTVTKSTVIYVLLLASVNIALNIYIISGTDFEKVYLWNLGYKATVFILLLFILSLGSKMRLEYRNRKYKQLSRYTRTIEELCDNLISLKHDFSNILLSINGYLDDNRISELREYLGKYVLKDYCRNTQSSFALSLRHIQNPALKGIIFSKLDQASRKNIKMFVSIFNDIYICNIAPSDLARIIGILLDNAIEACENSTRNELHLGMESDKPHISILIGNTYCQLPDMTLIGKRGYSTKGKNRGFGLYNLNRILSLYPHAHLKTSVIDNMFFQELIILKL